MPLYFFDVHNTKYSSVDETGADCANRDQIGAHALKILCAIAQDDPLQHLHSQLGAVVRDGDDHVVLTASVSLATTWVGNA